MFYHLNGQVIWLPRWLTIISIKAEFFRLPRLRDLCSGYCKQRASIMVITIIVCLYLDVVHYRYYQLHIIWYTYTFVISWKMIYLLTKSKNKSVYLWILEICIFLIKKKWNYVSNKTLYICRYNNKNMIIQNATQRKIKLIFKMYLLWDITQYLFKHQWTMFILYISRNVVLLHKHNWLFCFECTTIYCGNSIIRRIIVNTIPSLFYPFV